MTLSVLNLKTGFLRRMKTSSMTTMQNLPAHLLPYLFVFLLLPSLISSLNGVRNSKDSSIHNTLSDQPRMEEGEESENFRFGSVHGLTNVTVQVGTIAYMHCPVVNLGEREISWVRMKDWRILSHGRKIFTADDRFDLIRDENPDPNKITGSPKSSKQSSKQKNYFSFANPNNNNNNKNRKFQSVNNYDQPNSELNSETENLQDWILIVKHVVARDSGFYECQVTTNDGNIKSHRVELKVETPEAFILADEEYHIDTGSSLSLVCIIEKATEPPQYVFWYHNERMINYDSERGISVTTTPGRRTHSQLSIQKADVSDSGNYTCAPSSALPASIHVFVSGSEVKPWTSGANGRIFRVETIYLLAILLIANIAGLIHTPTTIWSRSLWLPVITNS